MGSWCGSASKPESAIPSQRDTEDRGLGPEVQPAASMLGYWRPAPNLKMRDAKLTF